MMNRKPTVDNKAEFFARQEQGEFGNRLETWDNPNTALAQWQGLFCIRSKVPGGRCQYNIPASELKVLWATWPHEAVISRMLNGEEHVVFQGELCFSVRGIELFYSTVDLPMRDALSQAGENASGVKAWQLLRYYLDASSFDDLLEMTQLYPDASFEFSVYNRAVGTCQRRCIFWEVRDY